MASYLTDTEMNGPSAQTADAHAHHANSRWLQKLIIGGGVLATGLIVAPHLLASAGFCTLEYDKMLNACTNAPTVATGIIGFAHNALASIPAIGGTIAEGGIANTVATGVIGIGGALLGNYVQRNSDGKSQIKWGSVIKTAALLTSAFIALPALLPALGMGVTFLANVFLATATADIVGAAVASTVGSVAGVVPSSSAAQIGLLVVPHLLTCGLSFGSAAIALLTGHRVAQANDQRTESHPQSVALPTQNEALYSSRLYGQPEQGVSANTGFADQIVRNRERPAAVAARA